MSKITEGVAGIAMSWCYLTLLKQATLSILGKPGIFSLSDHYFFQIHGLGGSENHPDSFFLRGHNDSFLFIESLSIRFQRSPFYSHRKIEVFGETLVWLQANSTLSLSHIITKDSNRFYQFGGPCLEKCSDSASALSRFEYVV